MSTLLLLPLEKFDLRYANEWRSLFEQYFEDVQFTDLTVQTIDGKVSDKKIELEKHQFLNPSETTFWKLSQTENTIRYLLENRPSENNPTTLFLFDGWFPGIHHILYVARMCGFERYLKIASCFHAGGYDRHDQLNAKFNLDTKERSNNFTDALETSLFNVYSHIFVATHYHKELILSFFKDLPFDLKNKIYVTGFPLGYKSYGYNINYENKKNQIVFPHRLTEEKGIGYLNAFVNNHLNSQKTFNLVKTMENYSTKHDYYGVLRESSVVLSFSKQETWGIAVQESVLSGCIPIVPDDLSYSEMYSNIHPDLNQKLGFDLFTYNTAAFLEIQDGICLQVMERLNFIKTLTPDQKKCLLEPLRKKLIKDADNSIAMMMFHILN